MKRTAPYHSDSVPASSVNAGMNLAQPDTGAAGNGDASNSIVEQVHHSAAALEPGQTDAMPFPGPYAYAVLPVVADQPGRADGAATHTTSAAAGGSSTATAPPSRADVPANSAMPEAPRSQPSGQASLPEGREADADGLPPLIRAVKLGDLEQLRMRLGLPGTDVNQVDAPSGATALLFAAAAGRLDMIELLLAKGADGSFRHPGTGTTALMWASAECKLEVVNALLGHPGILLEQANNSGRTALAHASMNGHAPIVERLINAGANSALRDMGGQDCIHHALSNGHVNVVESLLRLGVPLPDPFPLPLPDAGHFVCMADLCFDNFMPAASADNPLRLPAPGLLDDPDRFFSQFINKAYPEDRSSIAGTLASWLRFQGIRQAVIVPLMRCLGEYVDGIALFMTPEAENVNDRQRLVCCASTLGRLAVLAPGEEIAATYKNSGLSEAGVRRLAQLAIAQRDKLVALAEAATAQSATSMLEQILPECVDRTDSRLHVNINALRTSLTDAGFVPPLANLLAKSWEAVLVQLAATPAATAQMVFVSDMVTYIQKRMEDDAPGLFARQISQRLDQPDFLGAWGATIGTRSAEGLFALFDDQCKQLRQYGKETGKGAYSVNDANPGSSHYA